MSSIDEKQNAQRRSERFQNMLSHLCGKLTLVSCTTASSWDDSVGKYPCCSASFSTSNGSRVVLLVRENIFRLKVELVIQSKDVSPYECRYQEKYKYEFSSEVCDIVTDRYSIDAVLLIHNI